MNDDLTALVRRLRTAGCVWAEDEAAILMRATGEPAERDQLCTRRMSGTPLEQVVGWADFRGLRITVGEGVFVPRRRSEFLARCAARHIRTGVTVLDMCCGTGALGLAVVRSESATLHAVDCDAAAIACAAVNLGPVGGTAHLGDLFDPLPAALRHSVDIIVAVAPYVPTSELPYLPREARLYEPVAAHDGGPDGLALTARIFAAAGDWLTPDGVVLVEVSEWQAPGAIALAERHGLAAHAERDDSLDATVVVAGLALVS